MRQQDTSKLQDFVDSSKSKGATDEFLAALLTRRGWPAADVYTALGKYWEASTGLAIPERPGAGESARDAFLYLLSFTTLATWTTAVGSMVSEFINHRFPDAVSRNYLLKLSGRLIGDLIPCGGWYQTSITRFGFVSTRKVTQCS